MNCIGIKRYLVPKVVVKGIGGEWVSNKGSTSMLILCKCVEIYGAQGFGIIYLKNKLYGLFSLSPFAK